MGGCSAHLLHCHQPGKPGLSGGPLRPVAPFRGGFSSRLVNYPGPASGRDHERQREERICCGCQKLSRPISAVLRSSFFYSLPGFPKSQVGVPGVPTEPETASAQLSVPLLQLPVRSRLDGRESGWQHTCQRMGAGAAVQGAEDQEHGWCVRVACSKGDLRLMIAPSNSRLGKMLMPSHAFACSASRPGGPRL